MLGKPSCSANSGIISWELACDNCCAFCFFQSNLSQVRLQTQTNKSVNDIHPRWIIAGLGSLTSRERQLCGCVDIILLPLPENSDAGFLSRELGYTNLAWFCNSLGI
mmetsp:Transcript_10517/g.17157  ORF Transcript_10517/g.17157 Transcript_10517/m.17157 type:complete len:107 (-) Transcript_10517:197-517(-)